MASITEERLKEMEEEMNRFEEEISSVRPPMGRGGGGGGRGGSPPKMIIGSNTYHQVQAKLTNTEGAFPGHMQHPPRPPMGMGPHAAPPPPPRGLGSGQPPRGQGNWDDQDDPPQQRMPFAGTLPPPPPPPLSDPEPRHTPDIPLRPPPPPPLGAPPSGPPQSGLPRHAFVPPQLRHRPPPPPPPSNRHPFVPQHMQPPRPPPGGPGMGPRGPPMGGPPSRGPSMGMRPDNRPPFSGGGGFHRHPNPGSGPSHSLLPPPLSSRKATPPTPAPPKVIEKPKVVYSAAPVRNVIPKEDTKKREDTPERSKVPEKPEVPKGPPVSEVVPPERMEPSEPPMMSHSQQPAMGDMMSMGSGGYGGPHNMMPGVPMEMDGETSRKDKKEKKKKWQRMAAGITWEDNTLSDWDTDDFRVFCGDLGNEVTEEVLARAFSKYPSFQKSRVVRDKRTNKTRGYGFVSFKDPNDFMRAMREMNGKYVGNRPIKLRKSTWKDRQSDVVKKKDKEKKRLGFR